MVIARARKDVTNITRAIVVDLNASTRHSPLYEPPGAPQSDDLGSGGLVGVAALWARVGRLWRWWGGGGRRSRIGCVCLVKIENRPGDDSRGGSKIL